MECSKCEKTVPEESRYCMYCGVCLLDDKTRGAEETDSDWDNRILCPDGSCTGIIVGGKCLTCGLEEQK